MGRWGFAVATLLCALVTARNASAHPCGDGGACPKGFQCLAGTFCNSLTCFDDSDCDAGFRCDGPGGKCLAAWMPPCQIDVQCGIGFQCLPVQQMCDCSGGGYIRHDADVTPLSCDLQVIPDCGDAADCPPPCDGGGDACVCTTVSLCHATPDALHPCAADTDCLSGWSCGCGSGVNSGADGACATSCQRPNSDYGATPPLNIGDDVSGDDEFDPSSSEVDAADEQDMGAPLGANGSRHACSVGSGPQERSAPVFVWACLGAIAFAGARRRGRATATKRSAV